MTARASVRPAGSEVEHETQSSRGGRHRAAPRNRAWNERGALRDLWQSAKPGLRGVRGGRLHDRVRRLGTLRPAMPDESLSRSRAAAGTPHPDPPRTIVIDVADLNDLVAAVRAAPERLAALERQ